MLSEITSVDLIVNQIVKVVVNTTSKYQVTTAGNVIPTETIVYSGAPQNYTTPALANTIVPTSTVFSYNGRTASTVDSTITVKAQNNTTQFGNNKEIGRAHV